MGCTRKTPFGTYLYTHRVDAVVDPARDQMIAPAKASQYKPWGMYEFMLNDPNDLPVQIDRSSGFVRTK